MRDLESDVYVEPGLFFNYLLEKNAYSEDIRKCIENTVKKLMEIDTSTNKPGMLLGKIQSGKTRTFLGITGLAFDNGYDVAIILTKGTKALAQQTYKRLLAEYAGFHDRDVIQIFDIMSLPDNLTRYELSQKIVLVVKKQADNLKRLDKALFDTYRVLKEKNILMIDDEADYASIGFTRSKNEVLEINKIAGQIDDIRSNLQYIDFLQVTATPYSLYLQPEEYTWGGNSLSFKPVRPAFTELVPVPTDYVGGDFYYKDSEDEDSIAASLFEEIKINELIILKEPDRRRFKLEEVLISPKIATLRNAIVRFILGACIRRLQNKAENIHPEKYSFIVHTEQSKGSHEWQQTIVIELKNKLQDVLNKDPIILGALIDEAYGNLEKSIKTCGTMLPSKSDVVQEVNNALRDDYIMITKVNSEKDVNQLLDDQGQLKLRAPLNIFIGGQILDRGITIRNLIGFYYGRRPATFQQDTVLQHSRMFGYRPKKDLAVTRFYTTMDIYKTMKKIHEFDTALRAAFEKGTQDNGVVFIQKDIKDHIIPCSPNKILLSNTTTLKPFKRLLPIGFQTGYKSNIAKIVTEIDVDLSSKIKNDSEEPFLVDLNFAVQIIKKIASTLVFEEETYQWDLETFIACMEYLANSSIDDQLCGKIWLIVRTGRNISRFKQSGYGKYEDSPDTPSGTRGELRVAREIAKTIPALILLRQNGLEENGWRGTPFWWPVLVVPGNAPTVVYTSKSLD